jgi:predicted esterase
MKPLLCLQLVIIPFLLVQGQQLSFERFMDQLNILEQEGNYTGAQEYLYSYADSFPGQWFALSKEQLFLNEKLLEFRENISIYKEGQRRGYFYFLHPAIPRYKPYLGFPEFEDLVQADRQLYEKALEHSTTCYQLDLPPGFNAGHSYPLLIIFHGGNSNFQRVRKHWSEELLDKHFIKLYLQSYRHVDSETFTWRSGDPRSDGDIKEILEEIRLAYPVDTSRILVSGMSAGASYALGMALRGLIPVAGVLAFCPGLPGEMKSMESFSPGHPGIRIYILGGEKDFYRESQAELTAILERLGLDCFYRLVEGMAHQYPGDEAKYIREGLEFTGYE